MKEIAETASDEGHKLKVDSSSTGHLRLVASNDRQLATEAGLKVVHQFQKEANVFEKIYWDLNKGNRVGKKRALRDLAAYCRDIEREAKAMAKKLHELNRIAKRPLFKEFAGLMLDLGEAAKVCEERFSRKVGSTMRPRTE